MTVDGSDDSPYEDCIDRAHGDDSYVDDHDRRSPAPVARRRATSGNRIGCGRRTDRSLHTPSPDRMRRVRAEVVASVSTAHRLKSIRT